MKTTGVIIARFQTPYLHEGHVSLIEDVKSRHNKVIVVLGVSPVKGSKINPLDFYSREQMVKAAFPDIVVLPLSDHRSDRQWSLNLDNLLMVTFPNEQFVLYGSRNSFIDYYSGVHEVNELQTIGDFSATEIRNNISDKVINSTDFRAGIIYANYNVYPKIYTTVDIAVFRNNGSQLLLGRKPSESAWRLPGGFSDPSDDSLEAAARRELIEECGSFETGEMKYEKSFKVEDWRYSKEEDKVITCLFSSHHIYGEPAAGDDLEEVKFIPTDELINWIADGRIVPEHKPMLEYLLNKYTNVSNLNLLQL